MRKKTGNKLHTWEAALLLAVAAALLWGACTLQRQDALEQKVIRLHVIANSDSEADQALKLRVRDRVLVLTEDILRQSRDMEEARQRLAEALPQLQQTAAEEIAAQGSRYTVSAGLEETEFPTREYDGFAQHIAGVVDRCDYVDGVVQQQRLRGEFFESSVGWVLFVADEDVDCD